MTSKTARDIRAELLDLGYAVVPDVLGPDGLAAVRSASERLLAGASREHLEKHRTTGSMLSVAEDPAFAEVVSWPATMDLLRRLGFGRVAFSAGYVISKPAGGPRLFWHQDWLWWTHPVSYEPQPHQLFAMYYLVDTDRANGCLRVVPRSHRTRLPAHDVLARAHSAEALSGRDQSAPMFGDLEGEIDVPVRAGDLLVGDARLLHAAHANASGQPRTLLTLWYHPAYDTLPDGIQAYLADSYGGAFSGWPAAARNRVDCLLPYRTSDANAWEIQREPHPRHAEIV
jgi:ectoine hydroxylase-related dioxygenase (phytanoyl-CoA dioxygenase family)